MALWQVSLAVVEAEAEALLVQQVVEGVAFVLIGIIHCDKAKSGGRKILASLTRTVSFSS